MVCACVLLLPHFAAAQTSLAVDFDGDGQRDQFIVDGREPSVLRVWLSASDTTQLIRSHAALLQVIATDLDGDHRPELIARDGKSRIQVWTRKGEGFHRYRPRGGVPGTLKYSNRRSIEDNDREPAGVITNPTFAPLTLMLCASPRAPGLEGSAACAPHTTRACRSLTAIDPFAPRPPPTHVPS
jgi:hypothetical protein